MDAFIAILCLVWSVLCIILFFKVWGMCNNVAKILQELTKPKGEPIKEVSCSSELSIGDRVFIKSKGKESVVVDIIGGQYECSSNNKNFYDGVFDRKDLIKR